jgi:hypothetical protein
LTPKLFGTIGFRSLVRCISAANFGTVPLSILASVSALEGPRSDAGDDNDSGNGSSDDGNDGSPDRKPNHFLKHAASRGDRNGAGWGVRLPLTLYMSAYVLAVVSFDRKSRNQI